MSAGRKAKVCRSCDRALTKDEVGLNRKLLEHFAARGDFLCLPCLAEYLECSEDELRAKIEEFKAEGCRLFA